MSNCNDRSKVLGLKSKISTPRSTQPRETLFQAFLTVYSFICPPLSTPPHHSPRREKEEEKEEERTSTLFSSIGKNLFCLSKICLLVFLPVRLHKDFYYKSFMANTPAPGIPLDQVPPSSHKMPINQIEVLKARTVNQSGYSKKAKD